MTRSKKLPADPAVAPLACHSEVLEQRRTDPGERQHDGEGDDVGAAAGDPALAVTGGDVGKDGVGRVALPQREAVDEDLGETVAVLVGDGGHARQSHSAPNVTNGVTARPPLIAEVTGYPSPMLIRYKRT
jgi:hypothetical protein